MKHVLSIQDLSCTGRCSLTVALPTLSAMGCRCTVLPTALLSSHTGFPDPYRKSLTGDIAPIADHWQTLGLQFDGIGVGYLADPEQAEAVEGVLSRFSAPLVLDPAMADHGKLYRSVVPEQVAAMARLCKRADVVLPNVTEAAMLSGLPYRENPEEGYLQELTQGLLALGAKAAVITGVSGKGGTVGFFGFDGQQEFSYRADEVPLHSHGTGDLFAAVVLGGLMAEKSLYDSACLAAGFVERCLRATPKASPHGVDFESQLSYLMQVGDA